MRRETILSFDPSVSLGKYTIVLVINVAAIMLSSWSTCVIFQLWQSQVIPSLQFIIGFIPAIYNRRLFTGLYIMQRVCATHINMGAIYMMPFFICSTVGLFIVCLWTYNKSSAFVVCKIRFCYILFSHSLPSLHCWWRKNNPHVWL